MLARTFGPAQTLLRIFPLLLLTPVAVGQENRPNHAGMQALLGSLHAHSSLSGDVSLSRGLSPLKTFEYARTHGLDFLGISDHHKALRPGFSARLHLSEQDYAQQLFQVAERFNLEHPDSFVAIPGIEWGTIATGNHINIFGAPSLPPNSIQDEDYDELFKWINEYALFAQANHPYSWKRSSRRNRDVGNFGRSLFPSDASYVRAADASLSLMSIICSIRGGHLSGALRHSTELTHRDAHHQALSEYRKYLNLGFHLAPSANQDTHGKNPGSITAARTGIWVEEFTLDGISEAIQSGRVFATEDDELSLALQLRLRDRTHWMGSSVRLGSETSPATLLVKVSQRTGEETGPYLLKVFRDKRGIGGQEAELWRSFQVPANGEFELQLNVLAGEYLFVEVRELNGSDNPIGENRPADMNDSAWSSPIWLVR